MREAAKMLATLLCMAAMVAGAFLLMGAGTSMDDTTRPPHPYCEHAP